MEKTITIDGKDVRFKSTGATALRYKAQFGKDYFTELLKLNILNNLKKKDMSIEEMEKIDFDIFYNIAWVLAKTADKSIPDPLTWLDEFDTFPIDEILPEIQDLITASIKSKNTKKK